jgi:single-stranded-DNA-specific exonuclease
MPAIDLLHEGGAKLLITVDNGIRSNDEVAYAKSLGMSVIITDHHLPLEIIPAADAIINPKVPGDPYPNKSLAGVGVVYKLICRLSSYYPSIKPEDYLDLVALGTIADIVSLEGENRYLVKQGLIQINQHRRQSLLSVIGAAGYLDQKIYATDISFQIAPRINSSGRLADVNHLVPLELLLSSDPAECGKHAQTLEIHNDRRKRMSRSMQKRIEEQFSPKDPLPPILISLDQDHDLGVAGITAGHLTRKYYLPAIVGAVGDETTTASCRSIPEFDISAALKSIKDLFTRFGGHKLAAGFTIENQNLPAFHEKMTLLAEKELSVLDLQPTLEIDSVVKLSDLNSTLYQELLKLEPTGEGNPMPVFVVRGITAKKVSKVGKFGDHLKFLADDGDNKIPAIAFSQGSSASALTGRFDLACKFTENVFRGKREFQLQVVDIKPQ